MVEVWLPYGKTEVHISVPLRNLLGTVEPDKGQPSANPFETITESLRNPIESKTIGELVKPRAKVAIAIDGTLSPGLAAYAASSVVWTLNQSGTPSENITLVVGNGRREHGYRELISFLQGSNIMRDLDIVLLDSTNPFGNRHLFPRGVLREPFVNISRADLIVLTKADKGSNTTSKIDRKKFLAKKKP